MDVGTNGSAVQHLESVAAKGHKLLQRDTHTAHMFGLQQGPSRPELLCMLHSTITHSMTSLKTEPTTGSRTFQGREEAHQHQYSNTAPWRQQ